MNVEHFNQPMRDIQHPQYRLLYEANQPFNPYPLWLESSSGEPTLENTIILVQTGSMSRDF